MLTTKWLALPSWLFIKCYRPLLPDSHPWKKKFLTLADWHAGRTSISRQFDVVMWFAIPLECFFVWQLTTQL